MDHKNVVFVLPCESFSGADTDDFLRGVRSAGQEAKSGGATGEPVEKTRTCYKQEARKRRLAAVFLKGNNVVLISPVAPVPQDSVDEHTNEQQLPASAKSSTDTLGQVTVLPSTTDGGQGTS